VDLLEKILEEDKQEKFWFLGTCKNIVDPEDTSSVSYMENVVEEGEEITKDEFLTIASVMDEHLKMLDSNLNNFDFYYNQDENVAWFYDIDDDVEYFYGLYFPRW